MRVQLRGLSGDPALNGQCGKVGGFEGERVFVRLDNDGRVVKVKTINVRKEGGNAGWTRGRRWHLLALRMYLDRGSAVRAERQLKRSKYDKRNWLARLDRLDVLRRRHGIPERLSR